MAAPGTSMALNAFGINDDGSGALPVRLCTSSGGLYGPQHPTIQSVTTQTAGGQSAPYSVGTYKDVLLFLFITALSGTGVAFNVFVDVSPDSGTTWFQLAQLGPANISALPATNPYPGGYTLALGVDANQLAFGDYIRIRWTLTGTTPSVTFSVPGVSKSA